LLEVLSPLCRDWLRLSEYLKTCTMKRRWYEKIKSA
jgi:hypothetical protein